MCVSVREFSARSNKAQGPGVWFVVVMCYSIGLGYAPGRSRVIKAEWREVWALSLPIIQDSSAERITGRAGQRTKDKNENAGRLRAKGSRVGLNPVACAGYSVMMWIS